MFLKACAKKKTMLKTKTFSPAKGERGDCMIIDDMTEVNVKERMPTLYNAIELAYNKGLKKDRNFSENAVFVIFNSIERNPDSLPKPFEPVINQDGKLVFLDSEGNWKSVVGKEKIIVTDWCETPKLGD